LNFTPRLDLRQTVSGAERTYFDCKFFRPLEREVPMSAMPVQEKPGSLRTIWRWLRARSDSAAHELATVGDREVEQIAKDIGVSSAELYSLARSDANSADLLRTRMTALDLDCREVARLVPETLHDLQRVCTMCSERKRCAQDLARAASDSGWKDYCPNVATLVALDAMPWAARSEW